MNSKKRSLLAIGVLAVLGATAGVYWPRLTARWAPPVEYAGHANPVEKAATVPDQSRRADLIVRARVVSVENRIHTEELPVYAEDGVTVLEKRAVNTPFTDTTFEVLETLKGKSESKITVLQTGGTSKNGSGRTQKFELPADPIFEDGSEHFLFLVDITNDGVHSTGRKLYRVVNPLGRYQVGTDGALRGPRSDKHVGLEVPADLPRTAQDLRRQVGAALGSGGQGGDPGQSPVSHGPNTPTQT